MQSFFFFFFKKTSFGSQREKSKFNLEIKLPKRSISFALYSKWYLCTTLSCFKPLNWSREKHDCKTHPPSPKLNERALIIMKKKTCCLNGCHIFHTLRIWGNFQKSGKSWADLHQPWVKDMWRDICWHTTSKRVKVSAERPVKNPNLWVWFSFCKYHL